MLRIENISKTFDGHTVLRDVSLTVEPGQIHGLIGTNGAGKTTLLRIVNRIVEPDSGQVLINGQPLGPQHTPIMGYLPEERGLYRRMKVGEQAVFFARLRGMERQQAEQALRPLLASLGAADWWDRPAGQLSKGMQQMVQFAVAIVHNPQLLILDEPFSGFDIIAAETLKQQLRNLANHGTAILLSTHNIGSIGELCHSLTLLANAHVALSGTVSSLDDGHTPLAQKLMQHLATQQPQPQP
ncbi:MAG: ATP-binding cassette domain-containing protein [Bacteroidales bacterium]|nr:ATP-binding cassette domain-containing protein [Bacteroidales bacterium]